MMGVSGDDLDVNDDIWGDDVPDDSADVDADVDAEELFSPPGYSPGKKLFFKIILFVVGILFVLLALWSFFRGGAEDSGVDETVAVSSPLSYDRVPATAENNPDLVIEDDVIEQQDTPLSLSASVAPSDIMPFPGEAVDDSGVALMPMPGDTAGVDDASLPDLGADPFADSLFVDDASSSEVIDAPVLPLLSDEGARVAPSDDFSSADQGSDDNTVVIAPSFPGVDVETYAVSDVSSEADVRVSDVLVPLPVSDVGADAGFEEDENVGAPALEEVVVEPVMTPLPVVPSKKPVYAKPAKNFSSGAVSSVSEVKKRTAAVKKKAVSKKPVRSMPVWVIRAAQPGRAVIYDKKSSDMKSIEVGNKVRGLGRIQAIEKVGGRWVIVGTAGRVTQ